MRIKYLRFVHNGFACFGCGAALYLLATLWRFFYIFYRPQMVTEVIKTGYWAADNSEISDNLISKNVYSPVSEVLFNNVRVFCFIMSTKNKNEEQALRVNATWAKRCNKHIFVTGNKKSGLPSLDFGLKQTRDNLFYMIENTLKYIYENELENYDFFLKADYDTYMVMENLRFMLLPYDPNKAYHFGCRYKYNGKLYMNGGAGYVFSREAIRKIVTKGFNKLSQCKKSLRSGEDVEIGHCATAVNVTAVDVRDRFGRHKMLPEKPGTHLTPGPPGFIFKLAFVHKYSNGEQAFNDYIISFHHVEPNMMYALDSLFYKFRRVSLIDVNQVSKPYAEEQLISSLKTLSIENSIEFAQD